jgi:hypothetical protein
MTLAMEGEIGLPNRQYSWPSWRRALAQAANSSGLGVCPISAAQRRTMKPSIIFGAPFLGFRNVIDYSIKDLIIRCKKVLSLRAEFFSEWVSSEENHI